MNNSKVTVIMPIYNVAPYLKKCIESVLKQTYTNFELFLVDDGSQDESPQIIDKYDEQDERVIAVHQINSGVDAARNIGLERGTGKYVAFIDSDDWYDECYLEKLVTEAEASKAQLVVCNFEAVGVDNPPKVKNIGSGIFNKESAMKHLLGYNSFNGYVWTGKNKRNDGVVKNTKYNQSGLCRNDHSFTKHFSEILLEMPYGGI